MPDNHYLRTQPASLLRVTGEDAPGFLQSQFSADVNRSASSHPATYGLWLDRKGKVRADSFVLRIRDEEFLVMSYFCPAASLLAIVAENIIADDVEVEDITDGAHLLSCWGPLALNALERGGRAAGSYFQLGNDYLFQGRRSRQPSADLFSINDAINVSLFLTEGSWEEVTETDAEKERIRAFIPRIPVDIGPGDLPQEGGLDKDAVHFDKGCYLGQEVMARLKAMGRVNRGLYGVSLDGPLPELPAEITAEGKVIGELRSAFEEDKRVTGLALLKHRALEKPEQPQISLSRDGRSVAIC